MPQTKIIGGGIVNPGTEVIVDPLFNALRTSTRPLDHTYGSQVLGHYSWAGKTGTTVSIGAAGILSYLRWSDTTRFFVLMRLRVSAIIAATITAGTQIDIGAFVSRNSTAAGSGGTLPTLGGNNQKNRSNMGASLVTDLRIATTGALTGPTGRVADANPFAYYVSPLSFNIQSPGTATFVPAAQPFVDLYRWDLPGQHPIVLAGGETIELQEVTAGPTTGGILWGFVYEWAEVALF